jgi:hypothetical protein
LWFNFLRHTGSSPTPGLRRLHEPVLQRSCAAQSDGEGSASPRVRSVMPGSAGAVALSWSYSSATVPTPAPEPRPSREPLHEPRRGMRTLRGAVAVPAAAGLCVTHAPRRCPRVASPTRRLCRCHVPPPPPSEQQQPRAGWGEPGQQLSRRAALAAGPALAACLGACSSALVQLGFRSL